MSATATPPTESTEITSDTEQPSDAEILRRIQEEMASRPPAPENRRITVSELFQQGVALVASATGRNYKGGIPRVGETTALKLYELTLMWALNNRGDQPSHDILPTEELGAADGPDGPTPDEVIEASQDQSTNEA